MVNFGFPHLPLFSISMMIFFHLIRRRSSGDFCSEFAIQIVVLLNKFLTLANCGAVFSPAAADRVLRVFFSE